MRQAMTGRPSIVEFLRARLDDDEQVAREVTEENWHRATWVGDEYNSAVVITREVELASGNDRFIARCGVEGLEDGEHHAEHIARWDPARVLAEVETKRQIINLCEEWIEIGEIPPNATWSDEAAGAVVARDVLSLLALPYADHEDYDPAWAPQEATP